MVFHTTPGASTNIVEDFALNEGTADIMAQLTTAFANNPMVPLTYTMGSQIDPQRPFRFMYNPQLCASNVPSTCSSDIAPDLNCYNSNLFAKFGQMPVSEELGTDGLQYTFAGPLNHWFYLLAEGSNPAGFPASPTCDGSILTGLGIKTAGQIWYQALLRKTTNWTYPAARSATLNGALQLFPGSCTVFDKVKAAWNAVSVPALADEPTCEAPTPTPTATPTPAPTATPIPVPSPFPSQPGVFPSQPGLPKTGARPFQVRP